MYVSFPALFGLHRSWAIRDQEKLGKHEAPSTSASRSRHRFAQIGLTEEQGCGLVYVLQNARNVNCQLSGLGEEC